MNIDFLVKVLTSNQHYWIVAKRNESNSLVGGGRRKDSIIYIAIDYKIPLDLKRESILLTDIERLERSDLICNVFINDSYPPFQVGQSFHEIYEGYPIEGVYAKDFLLEALKLNSDSIWDYKKLLESMQVPNEKVA